MNVSKVLDYMYLTFPIRRAFLVVIVIIGFIPLNLIHMLPLSVRLPYAYAVASVTILALYLTLGKFSQIAVDTIGTVILKKKSDNVEYDNPSWKEAAESIGIKKPVKFYISHSKKLHGAFTNPIGRKIYFPKDWQKFPSSEQIAVIGHELDHIKNFKRFVGCLLAVAVGILMLSIALDYVTAQIFVTFSTISLELLLISYFARRNELHADLASAVQFGPEGLISVFEIMKENGYHDADSETHPRLTRRISRLYESMETKEEPVK